MKIATYNIWNSDVDYLKRVELLIGVLIEQNIDVLVLQEVRDENLVKTITKGLGHNNYIWKKYPDCEEGLAIISKYGLEHLWTNYEEDEEFHNTGTIISKIKVDGLSIGITNVHLDYKESINREIELVKAVKVIESFDNDYDIILGDFNSYPSSSIHMYLSGQMTLFSHSTSWIDLYQSFKVRNEDINGVTLDFKNNPRWENEVCLDIPGRFDWIFLKQPYPKVSPKLIEFKLLGNKRIDNITPSDHYGVLSELKFK
ncbi:endonuclease/exonuclease/phosphatase family protein [Mycoplasmatota bacterium WC44]